MCPELRGNSNNNVFVENIGKHVPCHEPSPVCCSESHRIWAVLLVGIECFDDCGMTVIK